MILRQDKAFTRAPTPTDERAIFGELRGIVAENIGRARAVEFDRVLDMIDALGEPGLDRYGDWLRANIPKMPRTLRDLAVQGWILADAPGRSCNTAQLAEHLFSGTYQDFAGLWILRHVEERAALVESVGGLSGDAAHEMVANQRVASLGMSHLGYISRAPSGLHKTTTTRAKTRGRVFVQTNRFFGSNHCSSCGGTGNASVLPGTSHHIPCSSCSGTGRERRTNFDGAHGGDVVVSREGVLCYELQGVSSHGGVSSVREDMIPEGIRRHVKIEAFAKALARRGFGCIYGEAHGSIWHTCYFIESVREHDMTWCGLDPDPSRTLTVVVSLVLDRPWSRLVRSLQRDLFGRVRRTQAVSYAKYLNARFHVEIHNPDGTRCGVFDSVYPDHADEKTPEELIERNSRTVSRLLDVQRVTTDATQAHLELARIDADDDN